MNEARIKLAEAMGWKPSHEPHEQIWIGPDTKAGDYGNYFNYDQLPDPETDANDDYSVLKWLRSDESSPMMPVVAMKLAEVARDRGDTNALHNYQRGDYARTACKVLEIEL